jgi:PKD repeat protein
MYNVNFNIYNRNGAELLPMSGYSLPLDIFKFVPNFNTAPLNVSDKQIVWNFGDGKTSTDLIANHSYSYPGNYNVTLTYFNSNGDGSLSTYTSAIKITNIITDQITLSCGNPSQISGHPNLIYLKRFNSYQTSVTGLNSIINLSVSGNRTPFYTAEQYYGDKYSHLYPSARFLIDTDLGQTVVTSVSTTNDYIYASSYGSVITLSTTASGNCVVAGSSGCAYFYYVEDNNPTFVDF